MEVKKKPASEAVEVRSDAAEMNRLRSPELDFVLGGLAGPPPPTPPPSPPPLPPPPPPRSGGVTWTSGGLFEWVAGAAKNTTLLNRKTGSESTKTHAKALRYCLRRAVLCGMFRGLTFDMSGGKKAQPF
jgi:hypothetical protein